MLLSTEKYFSDALYNYTKAQKVLLACCKPFCYSKTKTYGVNSSVQFGSLRVAPSVKDEMSTQ